MVYREETSGPLRVCLSVGVKFGEETVLLRFGSSIANGNDPSPISCILFSACLGTPLHTHSLNQQHSLVVFQAQEAY
jgi:hypothetical protein